MSGTWALITSEGIKLRRSAPVRLAIAAPALLFVLELLSLFGRRSINATDPAVLWRDLLTFGWILWLGLFAPALVAFEAIALAGMEHSGKHWKQILSLPIPRWRVFAVKMLICGVLVGASFALFLATSVAGVLLFSGARGLDLAGSLPWLDLLSTAAKAYLACWLLIVTHTWISVRFPAFAVPAGIGFAAMLLGFMAMNVSPEYFGWWYPWTLPINARPDGLYTARNTIAPVLAGAAGGLALAPLASWDLARRANEI
jgi:ABC-2 type transport system permease protein